MLPTNCACSKPCNPCGAQGPKEQNTVKVDASRLSKAKDDAVDGGNEKASLETRDNKDNPQSGESKGRIYQEEGPLTFEKQLALVEELTQGHRAEEERLELERRVREAQEAEQREREAELLRQKAEQEQREGDAAREELRRQNEERMQEAFRRQDERLALEKAKQAEEERQQKMQIENEKKVQAWLMKNKFKTVNELVRKRLSKVRPLHVAVQLRDAPAIKLLISTGADLKLTNGKNETPVQLARRLNKKGSHVSVICALTGLSYWHYLGGS